MEPNKCTALFEEAFLLDSVDILKNITNSTACDHLFLFKQKKEQLLKKFNNDLVDKLKNGRDLTTLEHQLIDRHSGYLDELKEIARDESHFNFSNIKPNVYNWLYFGV